MIQLILDETYLVQQDEGEHREVASNDAPSKFGTYQGEDDQNNKIFETLADAQSCNP